MAKIEKKKVVTQVSRIVNNLKKIAWGKMVQLFSRTDSVIVSFCSNKIEDVADVAVKSLQKVKQSTK